MPDSSIHNQDYRKTSLTKHIRALGLRSVDDYREWCNRHGFRRKLHKSRVARQWELDTFREQVIQSVLKGRRRYRDYVSDAQAPARDQNRHRQPLPSAFEQLLEIRTRRRYELAGRQPKLHRRAVLRLIRHLEAESSTLLKEERAGAYGMTWLESLATVASYHRHWLRPLEEWRSSGYSTPCQFQRLIRHLFVRYDEVPSCLEVAWLMPNDRRGNRLRDLYLHLGEGKNVRHWSFLPIPYTKRMSHHFMRCPDNVSPLQAFRWGQVIGLGVSEPHALEILRSRLGELFEHEEFWLTFFHWLVRHPDVPADEIILLIDFVHHQRFVPRFHADLPHRLGIPAQPNLCMRKRQPATLLAQAARWQAELERQNPVDRGEWPRAPIREFAYYEDEDGAPHRGWTIRQLLSSRELIEEGEQMDHCVATYSKGCLEGSSTIWTLEFHRSSNSRKLLTIEVDPRQREIVQVRGRSNRDPNAKEGALLERWAKLAGLRLATHAW